MSSSYDDIAGMYDAFWADWYLPAAKAALENLFFSQVPVDHKVLDVCCGCGHVTSELVRRGYRVTGIDASAELIALARRKLPGIDLRVQDARRIQIEERFDAALSTFDSLNHLLTLKALGEAFASVHSALVPGGLFVFDMNLEAAYLTDLREWNATVKNNMAGMVRGTYDAVKKKAATELVWFVKRPGLGLWEQRRSVVEQRCYTQQEITLTLAEAGFLHIEALSAHKAGMRQDLGLGRMFWVARSAAQARSSVGKNPDVDSLRGAD